MKPEDKELLLKDLSARLPYEPMVWFKENWETNPNFHGNIAALRLYHLEYIIKDMDITLCPYLRPMSSMTEDERKQLSEYIFSEKGRRYFTIQSNGILYSGIDNLCFIGLGDDTIDRLIDWLNEHHFDYRELIEKGLAIKATEGMYKK